MTRAEGNLTWHGGNIPSNELWIKLGGDKGRGSFKFNLQLCNIEHPNSLKNTILVSVFKAGDSTTNLHTALDMYKDHVTELQGMPLKYGFFNSFYYKCTLCNNYTDSGISNSSGDYEYLCRMYGLSGTSGKGKIQALNIIVTAYHQMILQDVTVACGALFPAASSRYLSHEEEGSHSDPWRH